MPTTDLICLVSLSAERYGWKCEMFASVGACCVCDLVVGDSSTVGFATSTQEAIGYWAWASARASARGRQWRQ